MAQSSNRSAFTLIEILVVIAIIVTLMGLLLAVVNTNQADIAATTAIIKDVEGTVHTYKTLNGKWPLMSVSDGDFSDTDKQKIGSRNHELRSQLIAVNRGEFDIGGNYAKDYPEETYLEPSKPILSGSITNLVCILDAWDNPLVYKPFTAYVRPMYGLAPADYRPKKPDTFQIWSAGPNMTYEQNSVNGDSTEGYAPINDNPEDDNYKFIDDITNWTTQK